MKLKESREGGYANGPLMKVVEWVESFKHQTLQQRHSTLAKYIWMTVRVVFRKLIGVYCIT